MRAGTAGRRGGGGGGGGRGGGGGGGRGRRGRRRRGAGDAQPQSRAEAQLQARPPPPPPSRCESDAHLSPVPYKSNAHLSLPPPPAALPRGAAPAPPGWRREGEKEGRLVLRPKFVLPKPWPVTLAEGLPAQAQLSSLRAAFAKEKRRAAELGVDLKRAGAHPTAPSPPPVPVQSGRASLSPRAVQTGRTSLSPPQRGRLHGAGAAGPRGHAAGGARGG